VNGEQDGIWMESVFIFFVLLLCVQGYKEKLQKATERNNGFHCEKGIAGNIRKSGECINVAVSRNGCGIGVKAT